MRLFNTFQNGAKMPAGRNQKGFAFVVVLGILLLVTGLAFVSFSTSDTDRQIASNNLGSSRAFFAAEAAIANAIVKLADSSWRTGFNNLKLGHSSYSLRVVDSTDSAALRDSIILVSTGKDDENESRIDVLMARTRNKLFKYGAFGDSALYMGGNALIDSYNSDSGSYLAQATNGPDSVGNMYSDNGGDIGSNGQIELAGNTQVHGDAGTTDTVIASGGNVDIYGTNSSNAPTNTLDPITEAEMKYAELYSGAPAALTITGGGSSYNSSTKDLTIQGGAGSVTFNKSGVYYFSNVYVASRCEFIIPVGVKVIIYMTGNFTALGQSIQNTSLKPENLQIYSTGDSVSFGGGTGAYLSVYAPDAQIDLLGSSDVYGSFVGNSFYNAGGAKVHFDEDLLHLENPLKPKYRKVAWKVL
ncbi:MAG: hypothetical protein L0196_03145 [candidate division Zixibacteria bacterium]|nr:hypothetical protein [candidate division Zixibacteria bacterium]